jgi:serine O-acetyltransferase
VFEILREDFRRYHHSALAEGPRLARLRALCTYGFIAVAVYRYGRWTRTIRPRWLSLPFKVIHLLLNIPTELLLGISIPGNARIGPGLYIGHFGGIFLHGDAGRNLSVGQGVTIGFKGAGKSTRWPALGNDIYIGTGAKVIGAITVGDGVVIGANTVVTKDVPPRTRVVGAAMRMSPLDRGTPTAPVGGQETGNGNGNGNGNGDADP